MFSARKKLRKDPADLERTLPVMLYADEGKGPKRGNYMITCLESAIGAEPYEGIDCSCSAFVQEHIEHAPVCYGPLAEVSDATGDLAINISSHSFLTRHFLFGLPDFVYKPHPEVYNHLLQLLAEELRNVFSSGFLVDGVRWYCALIAAKGDLKHMNERWGKLTRSYSHLGRKNHLEMCSMCWAGRLGVPWDSLEHDPVWAPTMFLDRPWLPTETPALTHCPFDQSKPEFLYKLDLFHLVKVGIAQDVAGAVVLLARLGLYDDEGQARELKSRLNRAHGHFVLWTIANNKSPALRSFTPALFSVKKLSTDIPWSNTKGSDSVLLVEYLQWYAGVLLTEPQERFQGSRRLFKLLRTTTTHCLEMLHICYSHGLFLDRVCAQSFYLRTMAFLSGFKALAREALNLGMLAFGLKPKFHALHHLAFEVRQVLKSPAPWVLNPACYSCDQGEDVVGKLCELAQVVSTLTIDKRVIQRHFLKKAAVVRRYANYRRSLGMVDAAPLAPESGKARFIRRSIVKMKRKR